MVKVIKANPTAVQDIMYKNNTTQSKENYDAVAEGIEAGAKAGIAFGACAVATIWLHKDEIKELGKIVYCNTKKGFNVLKNKLKKED